MALIGRPGDGIAESRDRVVEEIRRIGRRLSERFLKARKEGRELDEIKTIEREGMRWYRSETATGHRKKGARNGRKHAT